MVDLTSLTELDTKVLAMAIDRDIDCKVIQDELGVAYAVVHRSLVKLCELGLIEKGGKRLYGYRIYPGGGHSVYRSP
jgi:predicted transcriptional regulator